MQTDGDQAANLIKIGITNPMRRRVLHDDKQRRPIAGDPRFGDGGWLELYSGDLAPPVRVTCAVEYDRARPALSDPFAQMGDSHRRNMGRIGLAVMQIG